MKGQKPHSLEYTAALASGVFHYTCNSPKKEILDKYGIKCIGKDLGCSDDTEVLIIPYEAFQKENIPISKDSNLLKIAAENLLRQVA